VLKWTPVEIFAILSSANSSERDPRLERVLGEFMGQWRRIAQKRGYPMPPHDVDDAVQDAVLKIVSPEALGKLIDVNKVESWARSVFVNALLDILRHRQRQIQRRSYVGNNEEDPETALRDRVPAEQLTPEEASIYRQRLEIVASRVRESKVLILKFLEEVSEKEIAERLHMTRDAVGGRIKRFRHMVRSQGQG
jgi:RNA polymerase sigma factor (sigma-70 family)